MASITIGSGETSSGLAVGAGSTLTVLSGGTVSATTVASGGTEYVSGGATFATVLSSGGTQFIASGGIASATTVDSAGAVYVSGGSAYGTILSSGGNQYVRAGGLASGTVAGVFTFEFVSSGGIASHTTVDSAGIEYVTGGSAVATVLNQSGYEYVVFGGVATGTLVGAEASMFVSSGGVATGTTIDGGGAAYVGSGGTAAGTTVGSGGYLEVDAGGSATSASVQPSGLATVSSGGSAFGATVASGGTLLVLAGGSAVGATVSSGGRVVVLDGGKATSTTLQPGGSATSAAILLESSGTVSVWTSSAGGISVGGGTFYVVAGGVASGTTVGAGGSAVVSVGGSVVATTIDAGGTLALRSGASATGGIVVSGSAVFAIDGTAMPKATISGFGAGGTIDLTGLSAASATLDTTTDVLTVSAGGSSYTLQLAGDYTADNALMAVPDAVSGTDLSLACFAAGTRIATARGEVSVEALAPGDRVLTRAGAWRPVRWIGRRHVAFARHPRAHEVRPVRVAAGAFARGQPKRDLLLSPDHAVFTGGVLIPVRYLVNGRTVAQVAVAHVDYLHVELDLHDVIFAEGLACESFLDTGNRGAFANGGPAVHLHPDFALRIWQAEGCAELVCSGERLAAARRRLLARAEALGHRITDAPDLALLADGRRLAPQVEGATWHVRLPASVSTVTLRSRVWSPDRMVPASSDTRTLGDAIARLALEGRPLPLSSPKLAAGWHAPEPDWRWTDGAATLAVEGAREVSLTIAMTGRYWLPSAADRSLHSPRRAT